MSASEQYLNLTPSAPRPVWSLTISWNDRSGWVNGCYLERAREIGVQALAGCRMLAVLVVAAALELALPGMPVTGGAPWPLLASVTAVYALTSTYPRLLACAIMAGLLHDLHSASISFGATSIILLGCALLARLFLDRGGRRIVAHEYLVGGFFALASMLAGHVALALSYPGGSASFSLVLGRAFGSALFAGLVIVPLLRPLKFVVGRLVAWFGGFAVAFLCWIGSVLVKHLRASGNEPGSMPGSPVPA